MFSPNRAETGYSPVQPVEYSHKLHAGNLGMDCRYCHSTVEHSGFAAPPTTETCMNCHKMVKPDSPLLQPVRESYASGRPIPWVRVHSLPDYVYFNHAAHVNAGVSCVTCHGRVDQMVQVRQVEPLTMKWCVDCHRDPAPHIRPRELVTKLDWQPDGDPAEIGRRLMAENNIHPPENCSGCHR
ncbi:MAG TPA: cytochrome c3 family protein [Bryobacteraceae bacterium]|nr:cytochrome c3 family protein [Bryobacteraceae bacterium]HOQ47223.1 cytochrome c3 family protein [Bryobacteraceae bacterium]HPQ17453.1 cytochrome c3 family protein [Bryobacteraceae bacterium]HPU74101.1 cytochrome c3 family protein [Bryobacteraceae bacterium]